MEVLLAEGDTDALLVNQFEESIIESLQNDPEVATCLMLTLEPGEKYQKW